METAHQDVHDAALSDFDFGRQNTVIGGGGLNCGERIQSGTECDNDTQPVNFFNTVILCTLTTATQAEARAYEKAPANPPRHPILHHCPPRTKPSNERLP